ncbi:MAG: CDP-alcohol phosphatidyltransferase family protein [Spirochaetales bacterium]|nr:CDP-alcohol phosphatidyltransferase family protein [Spirochaetales bacterium]
MIDTQMRHLKDRILILLKRTPLFRFSPNTITTASFFFGLVSVCFLYAGYNLTAYIFFWLNRIVDGLDGLVARETHRQSDFGGYYDILTDFIIYSLIPLALALRADQKLLWMMTALLLAVFYVNAASWMYLSGLLEKEKYKERNRNRPTSLAMPNGLIEGTETILIYSLMFLLPAYHFWYLGGMAFLTFLGIPQRLRFAHHVLDGEEPPR